jgi:uncharacterized protein (TIGR03437 family)
LFTAWFVLAALAGSAARGAAPSYSIESIVNASDYAPGPFAPNSIVSIFGVELSYRVEGLTPDNTHNTLPDQLADVRVYVANMPVPMIYVCPTQINFLMPNNLKPGNVALRVVRQGVTGAEVTVVLVDAAPQLFKSKDGYVIAQHGADYSLVTPDSPAKPGEVIVFYATGLGRTIPNPATPFEIQQNSSKVAGELNLSLDGNAVNPADIWYAGLTPGIAGVYQINLKLSDTLGADSEIHPSMAGQTSAAGVKLNSSGTR